jgi:uncharacterized Zn-binding protein involved in type VI secretion
MGAPAVHMGALLQCSFGLLPASLVVLPADNVIVEGTPQATIAACTPANVPTFGMCTSLANPEVAAATTAALGVLTPMPCLPVLTPWMPGSPTTLIGGQPALVAGSMCQCAFGGVVNIVFPGAVKTLC